MSDQFRTFAPQLEVRTGANQDGRTIYGIAVPWNAPMRISDSLVEEFHRGAFDHQTRAAAGQLGAPVTRIVYAREHMPLGGTLIGRVSMMRNDAAGQYVEMRVAKTPVGDETLELVREGALPHLSVGFRERQDGNLRMAGGIVARTKADMFEIASTLEGAYGDLASAVGVRTAGGEYRGPGSMLDAEEAELRAKAEAYLHGLPILPDHTDRIRAMRLGLL
jgi:Escherichia/Staphylococcus phage prohead protease